MRPAGIAARWAVGVVLTAASVPALAAGSAPRPPALELGRNGALTLTALPDVLSRPEVRAQLDSGLTTSLLLRVAAADPAARGGKGRLGGARVDVRYELWDEVYLVRVEGIDGVPRRESLPSFERLVAWWRELRLPVLAASADRPRTAAVVLSVIPFSEAERQDAQRWFSQSVQESGARELSEAADKPSHGLGSVLDLLVATSIQRRALVRYDWTVPIPTPKAEPRR